MLISVIVPHEGSYYLFKNMGVFSMLVYISAKILSMDLVGNLNKSYLFKCENDLNVVSFSKPPHIFSALVFIKHQ